MSNEIDERDPDNRRAIDSVLEKLDTYGLGRRQFIKLLAGTGAALATGNRVVLSPTAPAQVLLAALPHPLPHDLDGFIRAAEPKAAPAMRSEWPPTYLVRACAAMPAPRSSGSSRRAPGRRSARASSCRGRGGRR